MSRQEHRDAEIVRELLTWYRKSARDLPWRRTRDPYAIWLSEVMLQQTRVETVVPYFERFVERYPCVQSLARAELDEVLCLWSGLGYYRRARQLHAAAREVTEHHGGTFPSNASDLRRLHGIGPYTAGAVASIAFDRKEPLVDGNVSRVLARLEGIDEDVKRSRGAKLVWATAGRLIPDQSPGLFNQALMELGATICTPKNPACMVCPVERLCVARSTGRQQALPVATPKRAVPRLALVALVVWHRSKVLLARRVEGGLFGGLWEPPMVEAESLQAAMRALKDIGIDVQNVPLRTRGRVCHVLTHRELDVLVAAGRTDLPCTSGSSKPPYERTAWLEPTASSFGFSTLARKVLVKAGSGGAKERRTKKG